MNKWLSMNSSTLWIHNKCNIINSIDEAVIRRNIKINNFHIYCIQFFFVKIKLINEKLRLINAYAIRGVTKIKSNLHISSLF